MGVVVLVGAALLVVGFVFLRGRQAGAPGQEHRAAPPPGALEATRPTSAPVRTPSEPRGAAPGPAKSEPGSATPGSAPLDLGVYRRTRSLFSPTERSFYQALVAAVGEQWQVFPKVRLLDLLWLPDDTPHRQAYLNRVHFKHVDFVLCDPATFAPVLAIELDGASHRRPERQDRDALVDEILAAAGVRVLHWRVGDPYPPDLLAARVAEVAGRRPPAPGRRA